MVEPNSRSAVCGDRWDHSEQCQSRHRSGRGFHRHIFGRMDLSGWTRKSRITLASAMLGLFAVLTPAFANVPSNWELDPQHNTSSSTMYNSALKAYESAQYAQALSMAKQAAQTGDADAQFLTGYIQTKGLSGAVDHLSARNWFNKAAEQRNTDAMVALGEMAMRSQGGLNTSDALHWFSMAANSNRADAMRAIGDMYIKGAVLKKDIEQGREWLQKAVDFGDKIAIRQMADSYHETDAKTAMRWYKKAAAQGDMESAYIAAIMYEENFDIKPDAAEMARLMRIAAKAGHSAAQADYGLLVYQGRGVDPDMNEAARWFKRAAEAGDKEGQFLYAFTLAKGEGVPQSFEDAYYWLLKSGEHGTSGVSAYDKDRKILKDRLDQNVAPATLKKAKDRFYAETN